MIPYRNAIQSLHDYIPGKSIDEIREKYGLTHVVKLASNENPLGAPSKSREALLESLSQAHLYPRGECPILRKALADFYQIDESRIVLGNGSDEILGMIAQVYLESGVNAISGTPTFSVYESVTQLMGAEFRKVPLVNYRFDLDSLVKSIDASTRVLFICNPNNPTGTWLSSQELRAFLKSIPPTVLVVLDQAYAEYASHEDYPSLVKELEDYPNLLLVRTFSKVWGLAGLRVGYALGNPEIISALWKVKPPFNVSLPAQAAAAAALSDMDHLEQSLRVNQEGMEQLCNELAVLGCQVLDSQANFLAVHVGANARDLVAWLESQGMIVRGLSNFGMPEWIRVTVGLTLENALFLELMHQAKKEHRF